MSVGVPSAAAVERPVDRRRAVVGAEAVVGGVGAQHQQVAVGADAQAARDLHAGAAARDMQSGDQPDAGQRDAREPHLVAQEIGHAVELAVREHLVGLEHGVVVGQRVEAAVNLQRVGHGVSPVSAGPARGPARSCRG
jgi:hypothetical protein